jgi:hypothetical protein
MHIFRDLLVLVILTGIITRILIHFFKKNRKEKEAVHISYLITLIVMGPISILLLGFDVAIAEFSIALIVWYIYDILRLQVAGK